jgi:hypothetical protein
MMLGVCLTEWAGMQCGLIDVLLAVPAQFTRLSLQ